MLCGVQRKTNSHHRIDLLPVFLCLLHCFSGLLWIDACFNCGEFAILIEEHPAVGDVADGVNVWFFAFVSFSDDAFDGINAVVIADG